MVVYIYVKTDREESFPICVAPFASLELAFQYIDDNDGISRELFHDYGDDSYYYYQTGEMLYQIHRRELYTKEDF